MSRFWITIILLALLIGCEPAPDYVDPSPEWLEWEQNENPRELERGGEAE